jgi:putative ABC transport system permease protein
VFRTVLADLSRRKRRLFATALAVLLGVAFCAGTLVLTGTVKNAFNNLFATVGQNTDAVVRGSTVEKTGGGFGGDEQRALISQDLVEAVRAVPGVQAVTPSVQGYAQVLDKQGKVIGANGNGPPTFGFNWVTDRALSSFELVEGHGPTKPDEVVIDRGTAKKGDLAVGDQVGVLTRSGQMKVTIAGIVTIGGADSIGGASITFFPLAQAEELFAQPGKVGTIDVQAEPGVSQEQLVSNVRKALPSNTEVITGAQSTQENKSDVQQGLSFFTTFLLVFGIIALIVGAFIIANTFSIIVAQRTRELALLRALGASRRQVLGSVLVEAAIVGLVAGAIGLGLGVGLAALLLGVMAAIGIDLPNTGLVISAGTVIISLFLGTVITLLSAILPARRAATVPPVAAMREVSIDTSGVGRVRPLVGGAFAALGILAAIVGVTSRSVKSAGIGAALVLIGVVVAGPVLARLLGRFFGGIAGFLRGFTGRLGLLNVTRNPKRTASSAAALMIGISLVAFISVFASSAKASIGHALDTGFRGDFVVTAGAAGVPPSVSEQLSQSSNFSAVVPLRTVHASVDGGQGLSATNPAKLQQVMKVDVEEGSLSQLGNDGLAISRSKADKKHWQIGSTAQATFLQGPPRTFTVRAIFKDSQLAGDEFTSLAAVEGVEAHPVDQVVLVRDAPGVSRDTARATLEAATKSLPTAKVQTASEFSSSQADQINGLLNVVYALLALAVIIALIGIANTLGLSILERTRELGLLRAVGMTRRQLRSTIRVESVLVAVIGTVLGMAVGVVFGSAVMSSLRGTTTDLVVAIPVGSLVVIGIVGLLVGVVASLLPARRAGRLAVLDAIATE